ncbi:MAG TPA: hypothetical protein VHD87_12905 [Acidimicrobiales bacterium]|nr:hypothetical protein [Acidimicrobiales bacterium]
MSDRTVYAVRLALCGRTGNDNYLAARRFTRDWIGKRYGGWPETVNPLDAIWEPEPGHRVSVRTWLAEADAANVVTWDTPSPTDRRLRHRTVVSVVLVGGVTSVTIEQSIAAGEGIAGIGGVVEFNVARPHLVHTLTSRLAACDARRRLTAAPWRTADAATIAALIDDPTRALPIIVANPEPDGTRHAHVPGLADVCLGLAHVVELDTISAGRELADETYGLHSAKPGLLRIYWPGADAPPPASYYPDQQHGDRHGSFVNVVARRLYAMSGFWIHAPAAIEDIRVAERHHRLNQTISQARTEGTAQVTEEFLAEYERDLGRLEAADKTIETLRNELRNLATINEGLRESLAAAATYRPVIDLTDDPSPPVFATLIDAVTYAAEHLHNIEFHPNAFDTAAAWPSPAANQIYSDLVELDRIAGEWRATGRIAAGGWYPAMKAVGVPFAASVSDTARTRFSDAYTLCDSDGARLQLGPHITRGDGTGPTGHVRVYMTIDDENRRVIIGHVGRHLPGAKAKA